LWVRAETIHAVTYFSEESRAAARELGLRGFWMGYFAFRAAPLGPVDADVVEAAFYNFAPEMVCRAIPDAWTLAAPEAIVTARAAAAAAALRRIGGDALDRALDAVPALVAGSSAVPAETGSLFGANRALPRPDDPVAALWQATTTLREHRGDAHVAALRAAEISGCQAHLLHAAEHGVADEVLRDNRGWTDDAWRAERERLIARGLLDTDGALTGEGRRVRAVVEQATDRATRGLFPGRDESELIDALDAPARRIVASGTIPFPNPMGLPRLDPA
jgi:hypothetical protein